MCLEVNILCEMKEVAGMDGACCFSPLIAFTSESALYSATYMLYMRWKNLSVWLKKMLQN